jgi:hypothetical protein
VVAQNSVAVQQLAREPLIKVLREDQQLVLLMLAKVAAVVAVLAP